MEDYNASVCSPVSFRRWTILLRSFSVMLISRTRLCLLAGLAAISVFAGVTQAQQTKYPKPAELPNPYRLVAGWPTLPKNMNGGQWGEVIRVHLDAKGNIWVFHRCF